MVDGYAVSIASLLLAGGALGDRYGHRLVVLAGLAVFGAASALCASAPTVGVLVAARVAQGAGAAAMLPGSLAIIANAYPDRAEQARALGAWAAISSLALPAGPLLGGVVVSGMGWRWVFVLNLPVVVAMLALLPRLVGRSARIGRRPLDVPGVVASAAALGSAVYAVVSFSAAALAAAVACVAVLVVVERRSRAPMLPADLVRRPAFAAANVAALVMNLVTNGTLFATTLYLQQGRGLPAWLAGVYLLPMALPLTVLSPLTARLTARHGPHVPMALGATTAAIGSLALLAVTPTWSYVRLLPALAATGVGIALFTTAVVSAAVRAVPSDRTGLASGVNNMARQAGTALGVATYGALTGPPAAARHFLVGIHRAGILGTALWLLALALTLTAIRRASRS